MNDITGLTIFFKQGGYARIGETGHIELSFEDTRCARTIREWTDLVRHSVNGESGTVCCPVCGWDVPHGHTDYEQISEMVWRPAFEAWIFNRIKDGGLNSVIGNAVADGYWWSVHGNDERARKDGGWAEREGNQKLAKYKYAKLQVMWECWQAAMALKDVAPQSFT